MKLAPILIICLIFCFSCNSRSRNSASESAPKFYVRHEIDTLSETWKAGLGSWLEPGVECYGLIVVSKDKTIRIGLPVKCEIVSISANGVSCRALEKVLLYEDFGCTNVGIEKGDVWFEAHGDIYKSRAIAVDTLKQRDWYLEIQ